MFALETFLPDPGDYSFLTGGLDHLTTKWWLTSESITENGMYGNKGMLYNSQIWTAFGNTLLVAILCALCAGTIGTLVGYCVSKNRRSKFAAYVNNIAFLPYLMPSLAVGVAFFIFGSRIGIYNTILLLVLTGTIKYIPFASRSALNSMMQLSGEIEEAAHKVEGVKDCCSLYNKPKEHLYLFYTGDATSKDIVLYFRKNLPAFMVPRKLVNLDKLPTLPNGKIDMQTLKTYFK